MKAAIFGKNVKKESEKYITELLDVFDNNNVDYIMYEPLVKSLKRNKKSASIKTFYNHNELTKDIDFVFCLGGDGTILDAVTYVRDKNIPIVGINIGRLGFLADISKENIAEAVNDILNKKFTIEERALLELETTDNNFSDFNYALNELTIVKKDTASMITIHVYLDDIFVNSYWADGLIISTPSGSTAYSLSVGGPIVVPNSENFIITPIAPHTLTVRPIVIKDDKKITIKIEGRSKNYLLTLDSRSEKISASSVIEITKSSNIIKFVKFSEIDYYSTIRNKLMWGVDKRN